MKTTITMTEKELEAIKRAAYKAGYDAAVAEISGAKVAKPAEKTAKVEKSAPIVVTDELRAKVKAALTADIENPHKYGNGYNFPSYAAFIVAMAIKNPDKAKKSEMSDNTVLTIAKDYGLIAK